MKIGAEEETVGAINETLHSIIWSQSLFFFSLFLLVAFGKPVECVSIQLSLYMRHSLKDTYIYYILSSYDVPTHTCEKASHARDLNSSLFVCYYWWLVLLTLVVVDAPATSTYCMRFAPSLLFWRKLGPPLPSFPFLSFFLSFFLASAATYAQLPCTAHPTFIIATLYL